MAILSGSRWKLDGWKVLLSSLCMALFWRTSWSHRKRQYKITIKRSDLFRLKRHTELPSPIRIASRPKSPLSCCFRKFLPGQARREGVAPLSFFSNQISVSYRVSGDALHWKGVCRPFLYQLRHFPRETFVLFWNWGVRAFGSYNLTLVFPCLFVISFFLSLAWHFKLSNFRYAASASSPRNSVFS